MNTRGPVTILLIVCICLSARAESVAEDAQPPHVAAPDIEQTVRRAFDNLYGFSSIQDVTFTAHTSDQEFQRSAQVIRQSASVGLNRMLVRFGYPQEMRDLGILLRERPTFEYDVFVYQPSLKKVRRVSLYQRGDRFFGTDLAFEDLEGKRAPQWKPRFLREDSLDGRPALVVELTPNGFPSAYARLIAWFDRELPTISRIEFYKGPELLKTARIPTENVIEKDGFYIPTRMEFSSGAGTMTVLEVSRIELLERVPTERFTTTALEFGDTKRDARGLR